MRASRLVAIVLHLQQQGRSTAQALADELEVSVRTIYRDVAALQSAGVPLWAESGPGGGVRLLDGWTGRLDGLTLDEADALSLAGAPSIAAELGLGTLVAAAQAKVLGAMPPELRGRASRVRDRFLLDAPGWFQRSDDTEHLATIAGAVWRTERVRIAYRRPDRVVDRLVDPLGVVLKGGTWYLVAAHRGTPRTYRVGRIVDARPTGTRFERPSAFDLEEWWQRSASEFDRSLLRTTIRVRLDPAAIRALASVVGTAAASIGLATAEPADDEGWRTLDLPVESEEVALSQLVGLGAGIEVLAPSSLRQRIAAIGAALAANNR